MFSCAKVCEEHLCTHYWVILAKSYVLVLKTVWDNVANLQISNRRDGDDCTDAMSVCLGLPERHKNMLIGIVVQRLTSRASSKMEPPVLVHEPNRLPVPEILQVHVTAETDYCKSIATIMFASYSTFFHLLPLRKLLHNSLRDIIIINVKNCSLYKR